MLMRIPLLVTQCSGASPRRTMALAGPERRPSHGVDFLTEPGRERPVEPRGGSPMKTMALVLGGCALLALSINAAGAGQCANEIDSMAKMMAAHDAGSGPTPGAPGSNMGQHPPTTAMSQADSGGTASAAASRSDRPQHPPTSWMNWETTGMSTPESTEPRPDANLSAG